MSEVFFTPEQQTAVDLRISQERYAAGSRTREQVEAATKDAKKRNEWLTSELNKLRKEQEKTLRDLHAQQALSKKLEEELENANSALKNDGDLKKEIEDQKHLLNKQQVKMKRLQNSLEEAREALKRKAKIPFVVGDAVREKISGVAFIVCELDGFVVARWDEQKRDFIFYPNMPWQAFEKVAQGES